MGTIAPRINAWLSGVSVSGLSKSSSQRTLKRPRLLALTIYRRRLYGPTMPAEGWMRCGSARPHPRTTALSSCKWTNEESELVGLRLNLVNAIGRIDPCGVRHIVKYKPNPIHNPLAWNAPESPCLTITSKHADGSEGLWYMLCKTSRADKWKVGCHSRVGCFTELMQHLKCYRDQKMCFDSLLTT
jgi:hypothetical protein